ncbi:hypothetical protein ACOMHN_023892 [Nucella lapillus]
MAAVKGFQNLPVSQFHLMMVVVLLGTALLSLSQAYGDDNANGEPQGKLKIPKFFGDLYCQVVCQKSEGAGADQCMRCMKKADSVKRAVRNRRFDDFGLDDYLFMRLLGRNLEDRE